MSLALIQTSVFVTKVDPRILLGPFGQADLGFRFHATIFNLFISNVEESHY
ncbi:MAG: hypothetical protein HQK53_13425 [Oligoflexia bacterium]|nr:hypothetical protein [Oligoflexia bacterium]